MRYEGAIYRPPSESNSLLIQATIGCPHNRCTFCPAYKGVKFRIRPVDDILQDLSDAREYYGDRIKTIFFPDGNTIAMPTSDLETICRHASALFPQLERITVYGSVRFLNRKSVDELRRLHTAGLRRIHCGLESGDAEVLQRIQKGATPAEMLEAGKRVQQAGIKFSVYILIGIGGLELSEPHALHSAELLNQMHPDFIRLRTLVPRPETPLWQEWQEGRFQLLTAHQALAETRLLVANLEGPGLLLSDHAANYCNVEGWLPQDKPAMLQAIDRALALPARAFRSPEQSIL